MFEWLRLDVRDRICSNTRFLLYKVDKYRCNESKRICIINRNRGDIHQAVFSRIVVQDKCCTCTRTRSHIHKYFSYSSLYYAWQKEDRIHLWPESAWVSLPAFNWFLNFLKLFLVDRLETPNRLYFPNLTIFCATALYRQVIACLRPPWYQTQALGKKECHLVDFKFSTTFRRGCLSLVNRVVFDALALPW